MSVESQGAKVLSAPGSFHGTAFFDVFGQGRLGFLPAIEGPLVDGFTGGEIPICTNIEEPAGSKRDSPGFTLATFFHDWSSCSPSLFK